MPGGVAAPCRAYRLDFVADKIFRAASGRCIYRAHRAGHFAPDEKTLAGQRVLRCAGHVGRRVCFVQYLPVYETQHAGKNIPLHEKPHSIAGAFARSYRTREKTADADVGDELGKMSENFTQNEITKARGELA